MVQLARLVDDLLDVSRITRNKLELRIEPIDLASVVANAVETVRPLIEQRGHDLTVVTPARPVHVDADPVRLAQALSNLLNNVAKYTAPGGSVTLTAQGPGNEAIVSVKDNGIGIPAEMLSKVFDLFTQIEQPQALSRDGLGIGLTLVKRLVEMHGGSVEARSEGSGCGSEFVVRLPAVATPAHAQPATQTALPASAVRRRILIVDDNRDAAASLAMVLKQTGHDVQTVLDGAAAGAGSRVVSTASDVHIVKPVDSAPLETLIAGLPLATQ